jgi:hypothetical protein
MNLNLSGPANVLEPVQEEEELNEAVPVVNP